MAPGILLLIGSAGIGLLLLLILALRVHPFLALLAVAILVATAGGIAPDKIATTIEQGMGQMLGHIALIIPLGAMIGRLLEYSGAAARFAEALARWCGTCRASTALAVAGFVVGIPVFFEVGVIMLMPIAISAARTTGSRLLSIALPMCVTVLIVHALLPPHPGPIAAAGLLDSSAGRILMWGIPIAALTAIPTFLICKFLTRKSYDLTPSASAQIEAKKAETPSPEQHAGARALRNAPGPWLTLVAVFVPIALILSGALAAAFLPSDSILRSALEVVGAPFVALLLDAIFMACLLRRRCGLTLTQLNEILGSTIPSVALIILVTGAGGALARVLVTTGIGAAIANSLQASGLPILALAFLLTMLLRAAQGPTTVALITTASIIGPLAAQVGFNADQRALICIAMGAGGLALSHVNDAGFWIVSRLIGLSVGDALRTWTVATTCAGLLAFVSTACLWSFA